MFIFLFISRKRAFAGMGPAQRHQAAPGHKPSLPSPRDGSNTPDTSGNRKYSARCKRRNFRRG
ncbi:hypothetical protein CXT91_09515 [Akkermansia muciniphila]|nr:hypothetical protein CXT91_09515 [Akkermansia muciniphila]HBN18591.1 hypothetical protein [Akkermansia sp.]